MTAPRLRILVVSPVPTDPPDAGNRVRIMTLAQGLASTGHEVHFAYIPIEPFDLQAMQTRFGAACVHVLKSVPPPASALARLVRKLGRILNVHRAFQWRLDDWYNPEANKELAQLQAQHHFDVVFVEYVFASKALEAFPPECLRVLDTHDCFGLRHLTYLRAGMRPQWFSTSLADEEAGFRRADIVLAIQAREAAEFEARIKGSNTCVIQVGHLIDMYPLAVPSTREAAIFLGSNNPINTVGARYFIEQVLPLVRQAKPNFELLLVGSVSNEIEEQPGVVPLGFVDSLSEAFGAAMVAINPVRTGTGINIKLLDAMAAGMPIVSTQSGARGMEHMEGSAFIVVNDDDATNFAQQVIALLDDSQMRQRLSAGARAAAENWNTAQLGTLFAALARRPVETIASARKHSSDQMNTAPTHIRGI